MAEAEITDGTMRSLVDEACAAFLQDFRYAEAMAKQASGLLARRS
jgi:hypothetical protein